jgi:N-acyl-D-aspartate/D-glutamate deacylase
VRKPWAATAAACIGLVLTACAPQAPDHSSWRDQAHQSLQDIGSNVATDALLVRLVREGRMFGKYQQIVALNSETNAGRTASHFSGEQPELRDSGMYVKVTAVMSNATDLLSDVRIALVRRDSAAYPRLARALAQMTRALERAEVAVRR